MATRQMILALALVARLFVGVTGGEVEAGRPNIVKLED